MTGISTRTIPESGVMFTPPSGISLNVTDRWRSLRTIVSAFVSYTNIRITSIPNIALMILIAKSGR